MAAIPMVALRVFPWRLAPSQSRHTEFAAPSRSRGTRLVRCALWVANDNGFLGTLVDNHPAGIANPNQFFVLAVDPALVPELHRRHAFWLPRTV